MTYDAALRRRSGEQDTATYAVDEAGDAEGLERVLQGDIPSWTQVRVSEHDRA